MTQRESPARPERTYLGDQVYASWDGSQVWLETDDGIEITNRIALDHETFDNLIDFIGPMWAAKESMN